MTDQTLNSATNTVLYKTSK